jgi:hypothetical protein
MRKLKWRLVGTANVLYGGLAERNRSIILDILPDGTIPLKIGSLQRDKPYVELGYGVENIFKFFRIDFIHRLTYLNYDSEVKVRKFGILAGVQVTL